MYANCPKCKKLSAEIQATDDLDLINQAKAGTLRASCPVCGYDGALPAKEQAELAKIDPSE